jgi:hypothetical protein
MTIKFTRVTPGIALSANEAKKLKDQMTALIEGMGSPGQGTALHIPDFKTDRGEKKKVNFKLLNRDSSGDYDIELISVV